jgi:DNA invertase Pin-like site-specific DNA recombinase
MAIKNPKKQKKKNKQKKENIQNQKTIAYLRVSTNDQDTEKFKLDILKLAHERNLTRVDFVQEKASSRIPWKQREIYNIIETLTKGDHLTVPELSRLGRSMLEIMEILSIATQKEINVYIVKGDRKLDDSIESKVLSMAFSLAAEIERDFISSRTKEALKAKKAKGVKLGRPKGAGKSRLDPHKEEITALLKVRAEKKFIAQKFNVTPATLHNWIVKNRVDAI